VRETLQFYAQLYGMGVAERRSRIDQLVEDFRIGHKLDAPMRTLSKGTLQRVAVAQAIMHRPQLAILDEPMSGLDPGGRKDMRDLILALKRDGATVLFSSHILSDAEALCDRVAILSRGRLCEVVDLTRDLAEPDAYSLVASAVPGGALERLRSMTTEPLVGGPQRWTVTLKDQGAVRAALAELERSNARIEAVLPVRPSLEQRFLRHVGNGANAD
jgi:ABC-2 type transport system ATP-binding protein